MRLSYCNACIDNSFTPVPSSSGSQLVRLTQIPIVTSCWVRGCAGHGVKPAWWIPKVERGRWITFNTASFFCAPYHSWEKGSVEQVNGLIRRFFPKGTNFHELGHGEINRVEKLLNNRPRKCLHYQTPYEVFREARGALHV